MSEQTLTLDEARGRLGTTFTFSERIEYLKQLGRHSQSFSTLQPHMEYFDLPGVGYMAHAMAVFKAEGVPGLDLGHRPGSAKTPASAPH